jgi:glycosyltransferase involved in cell wall biosynthesis
MASRSLSAILITHNEAHNLPDCLGSLKGWVDEVVIVDNGSTDDTVAIAERWGARVMRVRDWPGFGPQKNRALDAARSDWVLSIDADERLTPELAREIQQAVQRDTDHAFEFPRLSWYCGRFMRHSGWYPDPVLRLFKRGRARFSDDLVHERLLPQDPVRRLQGDLLHYSFKNFSQVLAKVDRYSTAAAQQMYLRGRRAYFVEAPVRGAWAFVRTYVLRAGFLDGPQGFALAISNAQGTYYRYLKLWLMGKQESKQESQREGQPEGKKAP